MIGFDKSVHTLGLCGSWNLMNWARAMDNRPSNRRVSGDMKLTFESPDRVPWEAERSWAYVSYTVQLEPAASG